MSRYAIVDLMHLFSRARHAAQRNTDAFTKAGLALDIVFRSLRKVHRERKTDHVVFCVDGGSWRYDAYPLYKASRKAKQALRKPAEIEEDEVIYGNLESLIAYLSNKTRCTVLSEKGIEGDDFVARWTQIHPDDEHVIISGDSDFMQLLAPNVSIYDGINDRTLTTAGVFDATGEKLSFTIDPSNGKVKIGKPDPNFIPEDDKWWCKALFVKIIRGDSGDGIFSAYPGITFKGSTKRIGIQQAWEDRKEKGYHWNNFMLQEWSMADGLDENGEIKRRMIRVSEAFKNNEKLIELTHQPDDIKIRMDAVIAAAIAKEPANTVEFGFLRFCGKHELPRVAEESHYHTAYLKAAYPGKKL